jgi:hypothetical protein
MKSKLLSLIKNKSFVTGFIAGVFITTIVVIVSVSFNSAPPNKKHLKGTLSGWSPAVGMTGVVVGSYGTTSGPCPLNPSNVCDVGQYAVEFPGENPIMCFGNPNYPISQQVVISSTTLPGPVNVYVMPL